MIDYNCMIGQWPFRYLRKNTVDDLKKVHEKHQIESGYVSNLSSVFYHDPFEGDKILFNSIKDSQYKMVISMNVALPNLYRDIKMANESFAYEGIRIYPSIHKYDLKSSKFDEFCHMVKEANKKLFISYRMGDVRLDYLINQQLPDILSIKSIINNPYDLELYVLNLKAQEITALRDELFKSSSVFFDSSDIKHETFAREYLKEKGIDEKVVFGSFFPLYTFESNYLIYTKT
ncbi:MAG: hypothetical protein KAG94_05060 [Clostridiales bacterium]|nr:hypothetical protein [Clostridiales bacterium]